MLCLLPSRKLRGNDDHYHREDSGPTERCNAPLAPFLRRIVLKRTGVWISGIKEYGDMLPSRWFLAYPPAETLKRSFPKRELVMAPVVIRGITPSYNTSAFCSRAATTASLCPS